MQITAALLQRLFDSDYEAFTALVARTHPIELALIHDALTPKAQKEVAAVKRRTHSDIWEHALNMVRRLIGNEKTLSRIQLWGSPLEMDTPEFLAFMKLLLGWLEAYRSIPELEHIPPDMLAKLNAMVQALETEKAYR